MHIAGKKLDLSDVEFATRINRGRLKRASRMLEDARDDDRRAAQQCVCCFYGEGKLGGAAMTHTECGLCGKDVLCGSTAVDPVCMDCAKARELCVKCGADIELRGRAEF